MTTNGAPPLSVKGVVVHEGRVLLLLNERDEWDLPGGRPDPGEDHCRTLVREVFEETGLSVAAGALVDEHLFEVVPGHFVRIVAYICRLQGACDVSLSHEHRAWSWATLAELGSHVGGQKLPAGYLGAIRQAMDQPLSSSDREV